MKKYGINVRGKMHWTFARSYWQAVRNIEWRMKQPKHRQKTDWEKANEEGKKYYNL